MSTTQTSPTKQSSFKKHIDLVCQLWIDPTTGRISHSKFWNNIACAAATVTFVRMGTDIKIDFFQWYLGLVGFQSLASKFMTMKLGGTLPDKDDPNKPK